MDYILSWMSQIAYSIQMQLEALRVASVSLDLNVLSISDAYDSFADVAQSDLQEQEELLNGIDVDLEIISRVKIHPQFLSLTTRRSQESGERPRTLGDYVSNTKMKQVADNCGTLHGLILSLLSNLMFIAFLVDLKSRFQAVERTFRHILTGTDKIREMRSSFVYVYMSIFHLSSQSISS